MFNYSKAVIGITALAATILPTVTIPSQAQTVPKNGAPNLVRTFNKPKVYAIFGSRKESFVVGCPQLLEMWNKVPVDRVSDNTLNTLLANNPTVAELPCNGTIKAYKPWYQHDIFLLIQHKNGAKHRHYVNNLGFIPALGSKDIINVDPNSFRQFPRGADFILAKKVKAAKKIQFPIRGERETKVKSSSYMNTVFTLDSSGNLKAGTGTWSTSKYRGFTGGVAIILTDSSGKGIWSSGIRKYGVDGKWIGRSARTETWQETVPKNILDQVAGYAIVQVHTPSWRFAKGIWNWIRSEDGINTIKTALVILI